jgi:CheY-like chemotaxis protein
MRARHDLPANVGAWQILVVEDEFDSVQLISKILGFYDIQVHVAHNGEDCLAMLEQFEPTLIVTDLAMPRMDGWQTLAALRANPHTRHIPVVAITAYDSVDVAEDALKAGFDAYFPKPVDPRSFVQSLAEIVSHS